MTTFGNFIDQFGPGDTKKVRRILRGLPDTESLANATIYVLNRDTDSLAQAVFSQTVTTTATADGQITDAGSGSGTNRAAGLYFVWGASKTGLLQSGRTYAFVIRVSSNIGASYTAERGSVIVDGAKP